MKAEHRKELATNTLSATLAEWLESLRGGPTNGSVVFWAFLLLAVGLGVGVYYWYESNKRTTSALWTRVENADTPDDLLKVAESSAGSAAARSARFERARLLLRGGLEKILSNLDSEREAAWKDVKAAEEEYNKLATELTDVPVLKQEALFGLAKAREGQGNVEGALETYENLNKRYGDSALGKVAGEQLEKLKNNRKEAEEFYAKLRELAPPPPSKTTPEKPEK